ncbi:MAG TPA: hypothetical protein PLG26_09330 [Verrucomicrobiota bacterium]|nr:MAG: hypothetical protein BWX48_01256 [Verrucomicrobia bacterium ADurb.Bin006]HOG87457.1 hypothetical protein [Verrucomicrobiota bacterium]
MTQQFGDFTASELYCPKCRRAMPVRQKLLLILPSGELYEYLCSGCATSLGERTVSSPSVRAASPRPPARRSRSPRGSGPTPRSIRGLLR